ncbi:5-oxoprolinase subunit PxpB [Yinghuangia soli]|uniref:5-oxoprolinase subunit PxpB n=1 Tax=Yinghuangia soli TaxID=2908204 RepID=A0AA41U1S8_9ACTN|nr:5-oxoprolinase subunit PxpB [Yinghuangia soli]MCF2526424.1 5-oxoprolinase subunit PxpB [Yinghuangia soli]
MNLLAAGPFGILAELASAAEVRALDAALQGIRADEPDIEDVVPAARTVLVTFRQSAAGAKARSRIAALLPTLRPAADGGGAPGPLVELPIRYDGPDLAEVAELCGRSAREVAERHSGTEFTVAFCGFAPGFGYLTGLPEELQVPRRAEPRTSVPAGAVGLGGEYCGVYPRSSPGGWQIIGTTDAVLFDIARTPAALLAPGTRVRFREADT